jgi:uncharacterized protein (DUF488 family)
MARTAAEGGEMIYTIGYNNLTPTRLLQIVEGLSALLVDCRHKPVSRRAGFGGNQLKQSFAGDYFQAGHMLGGRDNVTVKGIEWLRGMDTANLMPILLLCMEEAPGECHRHTDICKPHFPRAVHIYQDQLIRVSDLIHAESIDAEEYEIEGHLDDLLDGSLKL